MGHRQIPRRNPPAEGDLQRGGEYEPERVGSRKIAYCKHDLEKGQHTAKITVVSGQFSIDGVEITGGDIALLGAADEPAETAEPAPNQTEQSAPDNTSGSTPDNTDAAPDEEKNSVPIVPIAIGAAAVIAAGAAAAAIIAKKKKK